MQILPTGHVTDTDVPDVVGVHVPAVSTQYHVPDDPPLVPEPVSVGVSVTV